MSRKKLLAVPLLLSALSIVSAPGVPESMGGPRLHAADCWFKWMADSKGTIYCKEEGRDCHGPCPDAT